MLIMMNIDRICLKTPKILIIKLLNNQKEINWVSLK